MVVEVLLGVVDLLQPIGKEAMVEDQCHALQLETENVLSPSNKCNCKFFQHSDQFISFLASP